MKTPFLILFLFILTLQSFSQTINLYGQVIEPNNDAILYSKVQLTASKLTRSTMTDLNGKFKFLNISVESISIVVQCLGYNKLDTIFNINDVDSGLITLTLLPLPANVRVESGWIGFGAKRAEADIKNNNVRMLLPSGLVLKKFPGDEDFEKKYKVSFYNHCQQVDNKSLKAYNQVVFNYLDKVFGKQWRKEVRQDLVGL